MQEALRGIRVEMAQIREDLGGMRSDFREHLEDDRKVWELVYRLIGGLTFLKWLLGIGIPAIVGVLIALLAKHP